MPWHTGLGRALRARNIPVWDGGSWETRGVPDRAFTPIAPMVHHTAVNGILPIRVAAGDNRFGQPLCHLLVRPSGQVDLVAGGLVYGSGSGSARVLEQVQRNIAPTGTAAERGLPDTDNGNRWFVNIEVDHPGDGSPIPEPQAASVVAVCAELCRINGWPWQRVIAHKEWTRRKIDPKWEGMSMDELRARVALELDVPPRRTGTEVMGPPEVTVDQAKTWAVTNAARRHSPYPEDTVREIVDTYWRVGVEYGVRPDLALAQSAKETGFWSYGGDVSSDQWNFAGIGATGGVPGLSFRTIEDGVRAHVLRMKMYAAGTAGDYNLAVLGRGLPSSHWGKYPFIEDFNGVWAVPGTTYGQSIVSDYLEPMKATTAEVPDLQGPLTPDEIGWLRRVIEWWRSR